MKVVIAEKPSVAREIASLLGATEKMDGYLTGNGYSVTWAYGHLTGLALPEDYGIKGFEKASLPILPDPFILTIRKTRKDEGYVTDSGAVKQLHVIKELFERCERIIVATDAGREGELIFRYIYEYLNCNRPFERLWISSLTEKAIRKGFSSLKPGRDFDPLYHAARARSQADWLVGINASQALTLAACDGIYSLGRVQTPTLAMVCRRHLEHQQFESRKYWQLQLGHQKEYRNFYSMSQTKWDDQKQAASTLQSLQRSGRVVVVSAATKAVTEQPPLLFDLTGLQQEANRKLNLSAEETLAIAQNLYEKKFITYPRTGSKYIPEDMWPALPGLVRALQDWHACKQAVAKMKWGRFNRRIVNDLRVTDHHGLLVTDRMPSALSAKESAVYDLIAFRLLEALSLPCTKEITEVLLEAAPECVFTTKGCRILEAGWRALQGNFSADGPEPVQELPELKKGDELKVKDIHLLEKKTRPPALYTEADLLAAMESAGKDIADQDSCKALQGIGIGTPATRAAIIAALIARGYIYRKKKALVPTEKGLRVYHLVKDRRIADVAMTAEWEQTFRQIEHGATDPASFQTAITSYVTAITRELLSSAFGANSLPDLTCPACRQQKLILREHLVKCPDNSCSWVQFRRVCGVRLGLQDIALLVHEGRTSLIKDMRSKSGKLFNAYIRLNDQAVSSFEFEKKRKGKHGK